VESKNLTANIIEEIFGEKSLTFVLKILSEEFYGGKELEELFEAKNVSLKTIIGKCKFRF
jgi:hypothetical protein